MEEFKTKRKPLTINLEEEEEIRTIEHISSDDSIIEEPIKNKNHFIQNQKSFTYKKSNHKNSTNLAGIKKSVKKDKIWAQVISNKFLLD